jgi:predicted DCC family thiol-disulfide oxidoreductase YuxK
MNKDQLFYDGQCPLCVTEMDKLRSLADPGLELIDIHKAGDDAGLPERETLLGTLHLRRDEGGFLTGMDANVAAWQHTRYGWLWRPLRWPLIRTVADACYRPWARWRYRRLYGRNPEGV